MKFKECPLKDKCPSCLNFRKNYNGQNSICSGCFPYHCVPYNEFETKFICAYWSLEARKKDD